MLTIFHLLELLILMYIVQLCLTVLLVNIHICERYPICMRMVVIVNTSNCI